MPVDLQKPHSLDTEALKYIVKCLVQDAGVRVNGPVTYDPLIGGVILDCGGEGLATYQKINDWAIKSPTSPWRVAYDKDTNEVRLTLWYAKKWPRVLRPMFPAKFITEMFSHEYADIAIHRERELNDQLNNAAGKAQELFEAKLYRSFRKRRILQISKSDIDGKASGQQYTLSFIRPKKGGGSLENWIDGIVTKLASCARVFYDQLSPLNIPATRFPYVTVYDHVTRNVHDDGTEEYTFVIDYDCLSPAVYRKHWEISCIKHEHTLAAAMGKYQEACDEWERDRASDRDTFSASLWEKCPIENVRFAPPETTDEDHPDDEEFIHHLHVLVSDVLGVGYEARVYPLENTTSGFAVDLLKVAESKIKPTVALSRVREVLDTVDRWALNNCKDTFSFRISDVVTMQARPSFVVKYVE